jgi:hypothetical protein
VHGEAQVDFLTIVPINVSVFLEGPLTSDPADGAFFFSLRRSSIDGVFALVLSSCSTPRWRSRRATMTIRRAG